MALLTLIIIFVGGLGFFQITRWQKTTNEMKNDVDVIKDIRQKAENYLVTTRNEIKSENLPLSEKPSEKILKNLDEFDSSVVSTPKCRIIRCIDSIFVYIIGLTRH